MIVLVITSASLALSYLKFHDEATKELQTSVKPPPLNSTRSFTFKIGGELVYFEFIGLEVLKDLDDMLFLPREIPANAAVAVEDHPFITSMKFSLRVKCGDPSSIYNAEIVVERYREERKEWETFMRFDLPRSVIEDRGRRLDGPLIIQSGDYYAVYLGTHFPPFETPIWFEGIEKNIRMHAILKVTVPEGVERPYEGDVLYHAGNLTVVYDRGVKPVGKNYYLDHLHVYIEPFEIPYVKFKLENVRFLSSSELSSTIELGFRNVGSLPLIGEASKISSKGYADFVADFNFITSDISIFVINGEAYNTFSGGRIFYTRNLHTIINLPKPWEEEGWAVIIFPNETLKVIAYAMVAENKVIVRGQEGEVTLRARPIPQEIIGIDADPFEYDLDLRRIFLKVKNDGSSPFFAKKADIQVLLDDRRIPVDRSWGVVPPGETGIVEIWLEEGENSINYKELAKGLFITVVVEGIEIKQTVPPLAPTLEVVDILYEMKREVQYCKGLIINIVNNWVFPVEPEWLETYINGKPLDYFYPISKKPYEIKPTEVKTLTIKFVKDVEVGSKIKVKFGATSIEVQV